MSEEKHPKIHSAGFGSNIFVLDGADEGLVVIDAGMPGSAGGVLKLIEKLGRQRSDVQAIFLTHADLDHIGSLKKLAEVCAAPIFASGKTKDYLVNRRYPPHVPLFARAMMLPFSAALHWPEEGQIQLLQERHEILGGILPLETPGHTDDHVSFMWESEGVLFSGDLFMNFSKPVPSLKMISWDMEAVKSSARQALALQPKLIYPGHGRAFARDKYEEDLRGLIV